MVSVNKGSVEYVYLPVRSNVPLDDSVSVEAAVHLVGAPAWSLAEWAEEQDVGVGDKPYYRRARVLVDATDLVAGKRYKLLSRLSDSPEAPILYHGELYVRPL